MYLSANREYCANVQMKYGALANCKIGIGKLAFVQITSEKRTLS